MTKMLSWPKRELEENCLKRNLRRLKRTTLRKRKHPNSQMKTQRKSRRRDPIVALFLQESLFGKRIAALGSRHPKEMIHLVLALLPGRMTRLLILVPKGTQKTDAHVMLPRRDEADHVRLPRRDEADLALFLRKDTMDLLAPEGGILVLPLITAKVTESIIRAQDLMIAIVMVIGRILVIDTSEAGHMTVIVPDPMIVIMTIVTGTAAIGMIDINDL
jgi:hypothetical protein